ncbi:unnamed protein product, partial [Owenia fusiformis]
MSGLHDRPNISFNNVSGLLDGDTKPRNINQTGAIIYITLLIGIIIFGVIGNILSLIVLKKEHEQSTRVFLLKTLAITDTLFLISYIGLIPEDGSLVSDDTYGDIVWLLEYLNKTASTLTTWVIVLVTIDRYIHVAKPLRAPVIATMKRMRVAIVTLTVIAFIYNSPRVLKQPKIDDAYHENIHFVAIYECALDLIFRHGGPVITVTILNIKLINSVKQSRIHAEHESQESREKRKQTLTMISILSVFIVCSLTNTSIRMIDLYESIANVDLDLTVNKIEKFGLLCNSACNV